ncbi:MAG: hypothetical protein M1838_004296 [Thelocarpon superellum]|nr:MAG: hypothetical protein M1838_004296 [Thelocarpon superellum]
MLLSMGLFVAAIVIVAESVDPGPPNDLVKKGPFDDDPNATLNTSVDSYNPWQPPGETGDSDGKTPPGPPGQETPKHPDPFADGAGVTDDGGNTWMNVTPSDYLTLCYLERPDVFCAPAECADAVNFTLEAIAGELDNKTMAWPVALIDPLTDTYKEMSRSAFSTTPSTPGGNLTGCKASFQNNRPGIRSVANLGELYWG